MSSSGEETLKNTIQEQGDMSKTNQRAPSEPEAHACPPAQPSIYPVVYSRRWLCRAHGIPSLPVMPRPNTGLECNGGQGVAPPSTTAAAGSLHQGDVLLSCGVVRVQDALHPIKMRTDTPCLSTGPQVLPGTPAWTPRTQCGPVDPGAYLRST